MDKLLQKARKRLLTNFALGTQFIGCVHRSPYLLS